MDKFTAKTVATLLDGETHQILNQNEWLILFERADKSLIVLDKHNVSEYKNREDFLNGEPEVKFIDFI